MTRILITGAAGHIGRKLAMFLTGRGYELRLFDIESGGNDAIEIADLSQWDEAWTNRLAGIDCVVHLAGCPRPDAGWNEIQRLNLDMTMNVLEAASRKRVRRVVFASSNWVLAGWRWTDAPLNSATEPRPTNAYGMSKLAGERLGHCYSRTRGLSFIALRIGYVPRVPSPQPGPQMAWGPWGQQMWLSERDLCDGIERAIAAPPNVDFAVVNLVSENEGMRWDLAEAERLIGYIPSDHGIPVITPEIAVGDQRAQHARLQIERLEALLLAERW